MDEYIGLKKVGDNSLKDLVEFLKIDWPRSAPVIGKITQSQRSAGQMINLHVYVDAWPQPQLVILENLTYKRNDEIKLAPLLVYTRNMTTEKVKEVFDSIPLLRRCYQEGYSEFQDTECQILDVLKDASRDYGFLVNLLACPFIFSLWDKNKLTSSIPFGYRMSSLKQHHGDAINSNWKFGKIPHMLQRIKRWIQHSFSAGVFCCQTNEIVAWGFVSEPGCISALETKEEHRGKGLAKAIITELVRQAENAGINLIAYIEEENFISQNLFQRMGFRKCKEGQISFFTIVPPDRNVFGI